ncbi:MAG TPA: ACT domain-containing protein [Candidatus Acidoferrales bacterium]|jgi:hypothetical protein|nr:ACT domain-containing protein [Candidatus Acidoferrales bacterium]
MMTTSNEFTIEMEDRPGTLAKFCRALADRRVNILAMQSFPSNGKSRVHLVADDPWTTRRLLDAEGLAYSEGDVVLLRLPHRPGEVAPATLRLADANINIDYCYCGVEIATHVPLVIFGVADVSRALAVLGREAAVSGMGR